MSLFLSGKKKDAAIMSTSIDKQIKLHDGRSLGYIEIGDPGGEPLFYFHGFPGSRIEVKISGQVAEQLKARIIAIDRPGFGCSDFKYGRTITDWPNDVTELADALGLERFAVVGASGGGPYSAVCALKIPHRLTGAGIVCGLGPLDAPGLTNGMIWYNRIGIFLSRRFPWLIKFLITLVARRIRLHPELLLSHLFATLSAPDKEILDRAEFKQLLIDSFRDAFLSGSRGAAWELVLYGRPWAFRLQDIAMEVRLWHGELDVIVPPSMGRYQESIIPKCIATYYGNEGHFSLVVNHMEEIIGALIR